jgi:CHAT domain-containing protein
VYILRAHGPPAWVDLGDASAIDHAVEALREAQGDPGRGDVPVLARALDERIARPVRALVGEAQLWLLSPDGALNLVPFGALVDEGGRYLAERFTISYLTSGRDLLRLEASAVSGAGPVIIANPDFNDESGGRTVAPVTRTPSSARRSADLTGPWPPLPGTADEAAALGLLLAGATVLTGASATEAEVKNLQGPRILHIASHGFFLADRPLPSPLPTQLVGVDAAAALGRALREHPLVRSGLVLAGGNRFRSGGEDGILTALEMASLNLTGTNLVVLSACETGVGSIEIGEGVYGLRRALILAGAETLVTSLWKVADDATRDLMLLYYRRLLAGQGRAEALRVAQLELRQRPGWSHPFFWASFVPVGKWQPFGVEGEAGRP